MSQCRGMMIPIYGRLRRPLALPPLQPGPGLPPLCPPAADAEKQCVSFFTVVALERGFRLHVLRKSRHGPGVCVYYCSIYYKAVRVGEGDREDMCYERRRAEALKD